MKRQSGFSIVELLIVMAIMGFVLAAGSDLVIGMMNSYRQQGKIAETNTEGIIGLEMMRRDIESAGYGLPRSLTTGLTYQEATDTTAAGFNDSSTNPPRALAGGSGYLVVKSLNVASNDACTKAAFLDATGAVTATDAAFLTTDRVIVISPGTSSSTAGKKLIASATYSPSAMAALASSEEVRIIYGVDSVSDLRMPFNRADYYISTTVTTPARCAPGMGVLVKAVVNQNGGGFSAANTFPLLDCVADMEVVYTLDRNGDGNLNDTTVLNDTLGAPLNAQQIRDQLKKVSVYILAHEGQRDLKYKYQAPQGPSGNIITVGLSDYDLSGISNWTNYRWKLYTLIVTPNNLR